MLKRHAEFFDELTQEELAELKEVVGEARAALKKTFKPDWFNLTQLGNTCRHLHVNLIPRYKEKREFAEKEFVDESFGGGVSSEEIDEEMVGKVRGEVKG